MAGDPTASIKVMTSFTYRGAAKVWSNRYHFDNDAPTTAGRWLAFSDAVVAAQKAMQITNQTIVGTVGYAAGSDVPVYSKTYTTAGTLSLTSIPQGPGDAALMVRYSTGAKSEKNHPIYLFSYYHGVLLSSDTNPDVVNSSQVTAAGTYAALWISGITDGTVVHHRCSPQGPLATGYLVDTKVRHRDFPGG
jgi:hypothetical protein